MKASEKLVAMIQFRLDVQPQAVDPVKGLVDTYATQAEVYALKALQGYESAHAAIHKEQKEAYAALLPAKKVPTRGSRYWDNAASVPDPMTIAWIGVGVGLVASVLVMVFA